MGMAKSRDKGNTRLMRNKDGRQHGGTDRKQNDSELEMGQPLVVCWGN